MLQLPTQECDKSSLLKCKEFNFGLVICLILVSQLRPGQMFYPFFIKHLLLPSQKGIPLKFASRNTEKQIVR